MRRLLRIILWVVKGVLLAVAAAALVMWPVSRGRVIAWERERAITRPESLESQWQAVGCWNRSFAIAIQWRYCTGAANNSWSREQAELTGPHWQIRRVPFAYFWDNNPWPSRFGPIRYDFEHGSFNGDTILIRHFAIPLWLIALVTGAWPLASIAFALRRRRRRRRAAREGLCKHCGYDLRATPDKSGGLLAVCPECGKESRAT